MKSTVNDSLRHITYSALFSRICIIILQFLFNVVIPDHQSDGFISPANSMPKNSCDFVVGLMLGGLLRWDAQYFLHISIYGYVYENTLAFFPGFPCCVRIVSMVICFLAARTLFLLTLKELENEKISYWTAILYCINPASIFFSAPYSETLFSYFTYNAMLHKSMFKSCSYVALSAVIRSNGVVNVGFPLYRELKRFVSKPRSCWHVTLFLWKVSLIVVSASCLFAAYQIYSYYQFCNSLENSFEDDILKLARVKSYILAGSEKSNMCSSFIPYFYIQNHYWNVGFLYYFEIKQLPNFALAFPILYFVVKESMNFFLNNRRLVWTLGLAKKSKNKISSNMFVYIVHSLFLSLICLCFVHIQVTTRLICSSSPVPYWFGGTLISKETNERCMSLRNFYKLSFTARMILIYCLTYYVIGIALFCNFYPWT